MKVIQDAMKMTPPEFAQEHPKEWVPRRSGIERLMLESARRKMKAWDGILSRKNVWTWGPAGVGKNRWANNLVVGRPTMETRTVRKVVIEDWPASPQGDVLCQHLKIWGDRYCFCGETKGSSIPMMSGKFFLRITSNYPIKSCFQREEDYMAIKRRFCEIAMTKENSKLGGR
jgi:hypothetical protein